MPTSGISLYFTIQDGASTVLKTIGDQTKSLDKETQSLAQAYSALEAANKPLISRQSELKTALEKSAETVKDAKKAYKELGDEASELKMTQAIEEQDTLKRELKDVESQIKSNQSTFNSYREDIRKGALEADSIAGGSSAGGSETSLLSTLGQAGLFKALGDTASQLGSAWVQSAFGDEGSTMLSSVLGMAGTGAAIGNMLLPGVGAAVGAALGGVVGAVTGNAEIAQKKDEAFIDYYNGLYDDVNTYAANTISGGSPTAGNRERDLKALAVMLDDDMQAAQDFQQGLIEMGRTPPFSYDTVTALSKDMLGLGLNPEEVTQRITSLADAAAALDLSESSVSSILSYLESSQLAGKMESRVVKSLSKMGINVYEALAESFGISENEVADKLSELDVDQAVQAIYDYMGSRFSGAAAGLTDTYEGAQGILQSYKEDMDAMAGSAYNEMRTEGIQAEISALGGELGEAIGEINSIMGESQAFMENLSDQYQRDAKAAVLLGEQSDLFTSSQQEDLNAMHEDYEKWSAEYDKAKEEGNEETAQEAREQMQALYENAQAMATACYESSGIYQTMQGVEQDQIQALRDNTAALSAWKSKYELDQEKTIGLAGTYDSGAIFDKSGELTEEAAPFYSQSQRDLEMYEKYGGFAYGLDRVPYDNYPALLHEGERVLTAQEARAQDAGTGQKVNQIIVTGNNFVGTGEEMADQIAEILAGKLEQAATVAVPR